MPRKNASDPQNLVGKRVEIFWEDEDEWLAGTVTKYNKRKKQYEVNYDDEPSDEEDVLEEYDEEIWRVIDDEDESEDEGEEDVGEEYQGDEYEEDSVSDTRKRKRSSRSSTGPSSKKLRRSPRARKPRRSRDLDDEAPVTRRRSSRTSPAKKKPKPKPKAKPKAKPATRGRKKAPPTRRRSGRKAAKKEESVEESSSEDEAPPTPRRSPRKSRASKKKEPESESESESESHEDNPGEVVVYDFSAKIPSCKYVKSGSKGDFSLEADEEGYQFSLKIPIKGNEKTKWMQNLLNECFKETGLSALPKFKGLAK